MQIQKEVVLGLEPTLRTPEGDAMCEQIREETKAILEAGGMLELVDL